VTTDRRRVGDGPLVVGVIGRAGSGKSTVAAALAADGARVIDADGLGHQVTNEDREVRAALIADYGSSVYGPDGLDRQMVARAVFRDAAARERLNRLVHPRILRRIRDRVDAWRGEGFRGVIVIDAALLLDWGLERECDLVIAVRAPEAVQLERLERDRGWDRDEARRRLAVQRPDDELAAAADVVLDNIGSREALADAARAAVRSRLEHRARGSGSDTPAC
jgi:dephospho-CoA kinase